MRNMIILSVVIIISGTAVGLNLRSDRGRAVTATANPVGIGAEPQVVRRVDTNDATDSGSPPKRSSGDGTTDGATSTVTSTVDSNLRDKVTRLERGMRFLHGVTDYTAQLQKQEMIGSELLDEQILSIKCRHNPFSVYLHWDSDDVGREVIYVDGKNNGNLIAHDGGWKSRIPAFSLSPVGSMAMQDTRYPVTEAGILGLIEVMLGIHRQDLKLANVDSCKIDELQQFDGRPCDQFTTIYKSFDTSPIYRKSITWIDREWSVPVRSRHFKWPRAGTVLAENELDDATLLESYSFSKVKMKCNLTDYDFDWTNKDYHFH